MSILIKPILTEKATKDAEDKNRYTFSVDKKANKIQLPVEEEEKNNTSVYKVSGPRPISAAGSTYKTGRKAIAEAKKAAEEERKRELKANNYAKAPKKAKATTRKSSGKSKRRR